MKIYEPSRHGVVILGDSVADPREHSAAALTREVNRNLGRAVRQRRTDIDLTQGVLAERIGLSRASIANIEAGEQAVSVTVLLSLAAALRITAETLVAAARDGEPLAPRRELSDEAASVLDDAEQRWLSGLLPDSDGALA